jgi:hypothetical protein
MQDLKHHMLINEKYWSSHYAGFPNGDTLHSPISKTHCLSFPRLGSGQASGGRHTLSKTVSFA